MSKWKKYIILSKSQCISYIMYTRCRPESESLDIYILHAFLGDSETAIANRHSLQQTQNYIANRSR